MEERKRLVEMIPEERTRYLAVKECASAIQDMKMRKQYLLSMVMMTSKDIDGILSRAMAQVVETIQNEQKRKEFIQRIPDPDTKENVSKSNQRRTARTKQYPAKLSPLPPTTMEVPSSQGPTNKKKVTFDPDLHYYR